MTYRQHFVHVRNSTSTTQVTCRTECGAVGKELRL
uniref:Uncharacterized protein n=1 Tax=Anguilla anguilla TaxID=7936 RepID=A0A0E9QZZ8_ANGAN